MGDQTPATPVVSAIICTYNRYDYLEKAVGSLLAQNCDPALFEIIVVDNSPPGVERDAWRQTFGDRAGLRYVTEDIPGLANARNVAVGLARGEIVAFLDDDAEASPDWISAYIAAFASFGPSAQIAGGRIDPVFEAVRPSWLHDRLLTYFTIINWGDRPKILDKSKWVAGANNAFRRDAYLMAGGCNVALGRIGSGGSLMSNEETDLQDRIHAAGGVTIYVPDARVTHLVPAARVTREWIRRRIMWQAISDIVAGKPLDKPRDEAEKSLLDFIAAVPARERSLRAFFYDESNPDMFFWQTQALYELYSLTLCRGELFEEC